MQNLLIVDGWKGLKLAFQKGLENGWKSGKSQWKVREFWNGYWVTTLTKLLDSEQVLVPTFRNITKFIKQHSMLCYKRPARAAPYTIIAATCDFQQCCILTRVNFDEPVQPPSKLRNCQWCSASSAGWAWALLVLKISCRGSIISFYGKILYLWVTFNSSQT